jgi:hypothetical protein
MRAEVGRFAPRFWLVIVKVSPPLLGFCEKLPLAISPYFLRISLVVTSEFSLKKLLSVRTD